MNWGCRLFIPSSARALPADCFLWDTASEGRRDGNEVVFHRYLGLIG